MTSLLPGLRAIGFTCCCLFLFAVSGPSHALSSVSVEIGEMHGTNGAAARNLSLDYQLDGKLALQGEIRQGTESAWSNARLECARFALPAQGRLRCEGGRVDSVPLKGDFSLALRLPQGSSALEADLRLQHIGFSDAAGLHAGEKIDGRVELAATADGPAWRWHADVDWQRGEVFWQPFYFPSGGHHLRAAGSLDPQSLVLDEATLTLARVGEAKFEGRWRRAEGVLEALDLDTSRLDLAGLYPLLLKPLLQKTALNDLEVGGEATLGLGLHNGEFTRFDLDLRQADIEDKRGRFALYKIDATLPWSYEDAKQLKLDYAGGKLLNLPLGPAKLAAEVNRYALTADTLALPILDGALQLSDVSAARMGDQWHWHLRANVAPISMPAFTRALGWPTMQGELAAAIPLVTYSNGRLTTDGDMRFNVFNGSATVTNLAMQEPLGMTPRLSADVRFRNLDLGALTRTFSFGAIEGRLDGDVAGLQLVNWQPVQFDAALYSSPGDYKKKISQRAVENISALGGAGAAAAIQRSFLRFFDDFNYKMIGLSCRLRNDQCLMGGIESVRNAQQGVIAADTSSAAFVIVQGSGVPAITVMGYNHHVSWDELLSRLKRITAGNAPIIK